MSQLRQKIKEARLRLVRMHYEAGVGHLGGNLSCLDALLVLFHSYRRQDDAVILSKGHSAGALYVALWSAGLLEEKWLETFHADGTKLAGHPAPNWLPEIPFATGSLGHGLSLAAGMALGKRLKSERGNIFCLTSDGEWQEGSTWEALIFASHHRLTNLTVLVDSNSLQAFGSPKEIASLEALADRIRAFAVPVLEIDGHSPDDLKRAIEVETPSSKIILMHTTKGKGISFLEGKIESHYWPLSETQYRSAIEEIENT